MRRLAALTTVLALHVSNFYAQESEQDAEQGVTLPEYIGMIAEKDVPNADEYFYMANGTLQVAQAVSQSGGEALPKPVILDALDAVEAGRNLEPDSADWDNLEQKLLKLLDPPTSDQQQEQENQDSQNQEQQDQDSQGEQGSQEDSESGEQQQDQQGQEQGSDQQSQEDQGESQDQQQSEDPSQDQGQSSGEQGSDGQEGELPPAQDGAQMGDLQNQDPQDIQLDGNEEPQPTPPQEQMQTLGGQQISGEPIDAENAAVKQMLEQLRQQDDPGKLFKILQDAQDGGKQNSQPNTKDW